MKRSMTVEELKDGLELVRIAAYTMIRGRAAEITIEELCSAGNLGLVEAWSTFDDSLNTKFSTFSYYRIHGAMKDYIRNAAKIHAMEDGVDSVAVQGTLVDDSFRTSIDDFLELRRAHWIRCKDDEHAMLLGSVLGDSTLNEMGAQLGTCKSWAGRIKQRGLNRFRRAMGLKEVAVQGGECV